MLNDMVNNEETLDNVFSALSDPTRRAILSRLKLGEHTVSTLAEPFKMSLPAISKHLRILEASGLITRRKEGRTHYLSLKGDKMQTASEWLATYQQFWDERFDVLAQLVEKNEDEIE